MQRSPRRSACGPEGNATAVTVIPRILLFDWRTHVRFFPLGYSKQNRFEFPVEFETNRCDPVISELTEER